MENVYKVKIQTNPDPRWLYPSERRYSASIVLGLAVVHLAFAILALLMACLTVTSYTSNDIFINKTEEDINNHTTDKFSSINETVFHEKINPSTTLTATPCLLFIGSIGAGFTGLLAWKRWYIDQNIKWFFCMSLLSTMTSTVSLVLVVLLIIFVNDYFHSNILFKEYYFNPSAKDVITINILIASILEWLWSILSIKVSFGGMINNYPDDLVISKGGIKTENITVRRGNKTGKIIPPDILNHCIPGKIFKHKKQKDNLPKDESNSEYYERVNKFLYSETECNAAQIR